MSVDKYADDHFEAEIRLSNGKPITKRFKVEDLNDPAQVETQKQAAKAWVAKCLKNSLSGWSIIWISGCNEPVTIAEGA